MSVLGAHTPATRLPERTQVFRVVGPRLVAFEAIWEDRLLWAMTKSLSQYCTSVSIFVLIIWRSLTREDAGNMQARGGEDRRWRRGTCFDEVGSEASADGSMSEVSLYHEELALEVVSGII